MTSEFNLRFVVAAAVVVAWMALRDRLLGVSSSLSVLFEWTGLLILTVALVAFVRAITFWLETAIAGVALVLIARSIADRQIINDYPHYWGGFGESVLVIAILISCFTLLGVLLFLICPRFLSGVGSRVISRVSVVFALAGIFWAVPTVIQPFDAFLNIGDSTEKVLDEVAGWAGGRIPGVEMSWYHNSLLGLPLAPLSVISGYGVEKVVVIVVYVNFLVLLVPLTMALLIREVLPLLGKSHAFAISLFSVSISGEKLNSSLFQELGNLARTLAPLLLGVLVVKAGVSKSRASSRGIILVSIAAALTLWNNIEFGFSAAAASVIVIYLANRTSGNVVQALVTFFAGFMATTILILVPGFFYGGNWFARRLGGIGDVFFGDMSINNSNNLGPIPPFSLISIWFALAVATFVTGVRGFLFAKEPRPNNNGILLSTFFGAWSLFSAPYLLHGGGSGSFRTQLLLIPVVMMICSLLGSVREDFAFVANRKNQISLERMGVFRELVRLIPLALLISFVVASVIQIPNGFQEWRRVQSPLGAIQSLDEWSPEQLDWISPERVRQLAESHGGVDQVGWWFAYGNAIEILTGVENLLGVSGFEVIRSPNQYQLACEPLLRSRKLYIISLADLQAQLDGCGLASVRAVTAPNEDGMVVYEVARERDSM